MTKLPTITSNRMDESITRRYTLGTLGSVTITRTSDPEVRTLTLQCGSTTNSWHLSEAKELAEALPALVKELETL